MEEDPHKTTQPGSPRMEEEPWLPSRGRHHGHLRKHVNFTRPFWIKELRTPNMSSAYTGPEPGGHTKSMHGRLNYGARRAPAKETSRTSATQKKHGSSITSFLDNEIGNAKYAPRAYWAKQFVCQKAVARIVKSQNAGSCHGTAKQFVCQKCYSIRSPSKTSFARVSRLSMWDAVCLQCFHAVLWVYLELREWTD